MSPVARQALAEWFIPPYFTAAVIAAALIYSRGFRRLHARRPERFPNWRLAAFLGGLGAMLIAIASPMAAFDDLLLQVHMAQHMLLMFAAPPLILLGAPQIPLLFGLPKIVAHRLIKPLLGSHLLHKIGGMLANPAVCWLAMAASMWTWHAPRPFQLALRSEGWHEFEHWCFLTAAVLFWWPVVEPWPSKLRWPRWTMVPYLLLADAQNSVLSALLTFSDRVIYPYYATVPRLDGITPLNDQIAAGLIMWVPGSLFFLIPALRIVLSVLKERNAVNPADLYKSRTTEWEVLAARLATSRGKSEMT